MRRLHKGVGDKIIKKQKQCGPSALIRLYLYSILSTLLSRVLLKTAGILTRRWGVGSYGAAGASAPGPFQTTFSSRMSPFVTPTFCNGNCHYNMNSENVGEGGFLLEDFPYITYLACALRCSPNPCCASRP